MAAPAITKADPKVDVKTDASSAGVIANDKKPAATKKVDLLVHELFAVGLFAEYIQDGTMIDAIMAELTKVGPTTKKIDLTTLSLGIFGGPGTTKEKLKDIQQNQLFEERMADLINAFFPNLTEFGLPLEVANNINPSANDTQQQLADCTAILAKVSVKKPTIKQPVKYSSAIDAYNARTSEVCLWVQPIGKLKMVLKNGTTQFETAAKWPES